ncbi:iron-sulfur cluster assembly scaffold protein [Desulfallas thermosapovorans]|uniref:Nitrogen fixation NifU-like protein n=1 Tax=Desulfallas thermosapovorans DSM 6562 TaxID=1121431 RepID=A0A5S4ZQF7_9FIRM|nr:iron-sulfur cluster assembly scaffold protein [Desulfallas thermosapovorans]TYO94835.1 nitrogen fixation NifU-like protein [Desulfallas thermosapovorans DSM 6562]
MSVLEYNELTLDHFENPRNVGVVENNNGYGKVGEAGCGDICEITLRIEKDVIEDIKFRVYGCAGAIATSSVVTEMTRGKDINYALQLNDDDVVEYLGGLPEKKKHCSLLAIKAVHQAIYDYLLNRRLRERKINTREEFDQINNEIMQEIIARSNRA